jgi:hypothetical protein|tara:strand:+ start:3087 stop:3539 length:453 start_codon:yes stop_codon:yes gene_type:complete
MTYPLPRNIELEDSTVVYGTGKILKVGSTANHADLSTATSVAIGITTASSSRSGADHTLTTTGATVSYYPLGGVLMVQCAAAATFDFGDTVYVGADGLATSTAGSNKKLGLYVGDSAHAATALSAPLSGDTASATEGALIPVDTHGAAIA